MKKTTRKRLILLMISCLCLMYYQFSFGQESYKIVNAFPNVGNFTLVTDIQSHNNKMYICEAKGKIYVFDNSPNVSVRKTFADLSGIVSDRFGSYGVLSLVFSPYFEANRHIYVAYTYASSQDSIVYWALAQFTVSPTNHDSVITSSKTMIIDSIKFDKPGHPGGGMVFRKDSGTYHLYYALGDNSWDNDSLMDRGYLAQKLDNLYGKVLRIKVDTTTSQWGNYDIPSDNPLFNDTTGKRKEIYAWGFRNPWRMSLDTLTNIIWVGDVGENIWEEINIIIEKGRNYGWNIKVGPECNYYFPPNDPCDTIGKNLKDPFYAYEHVAPLGRSVTGGYVYRGHQFPELYGQYIFADWVLGKVWALNTNTRIAQPLFDTTNFSFTTFGRDQNGELYLGTSKNNDVIYKLSSPKLNLTCLIEGFYNSYNNSMSRDTVRTYMRNNTSPYIIVDSNTAVLDSTGKGIISFPRITNGTFYYLQVNHRNSIETWSATTQRFQNGTMNYNFTTAASQAYGNNLVLKNGKYCIYSGDVNQDGIIDASDLGQVDNAVYNYTSGYVQTDLNGDDFVDSSDLAIVDNNASQFISAIKP